MNRIKLTQFPKNKKIDTQSLSAEQQIIRIVSTQEPSETKKCKTCGQTLPIAEFYLKDQTGRRASKCRDCQMKASGVIELGKFRFAKIIADKGFRRCSVCKTIKPLSQFHKHKTSYKGHSNNCKKCNAALYHTYIIDQRKTIGIQYIREYGKRNYGLKVFDDKTLKQLRKEILKNRSSKYFLDGKEFVTLLSFAEYIHNEYKIPLTAVLKRVSMGYTGEQLKLTEAEARSNAYTKGAIQVTNTVTNEVFHFKNTKDPGLLSMFSTATINRGIHTGKKTTITSLSKYKYPCIISRI